MGTDGRIYVADTYNHTIRAGIPSEISAALVGQLTTIGASMTDLTLAFQSLFQDSSFTISGNTLADKIDTLVAAIERLQSGHAKALYKELKTP